MFVLILALTSAFGLAHAQESSSAAPPMAIPIGGSTTSTGSRPPEPPGDLRGASSFRSGHLEIRSITSWHGGGSWVIHEGYGWGGRGPRFGMGFSTVVTAPMVPDHAWTVFQGPKRLTVPEYLDLVQDSRATDLRRRIRSNQNATTALTTVGVAGIVAVVTGIIGAEADYPINRRDWNNVALAGTGGILIGFGGGSLTHNTARRLESDFGELGWEPTRAQVDDYNERLRTDLGLSSDQAWKIIESGGGSGPPR